tara:strand:+ start:1970 stop:2473 length:504 start_codon:yes stop_codon:yes gene_type:complete
MGFFSKRVQQILVQAAENIVREAKSNLEDGALKESIKAKENDGSIEIIMDKYGLFQDKGVSGRNSSDFKGKRKEVHKSLSGYKFKSKVIGGEKLIDKWMYKKGIQPRDEKSGRFIKRKSANFLLRRSIAQHGIKPSLFLTRPYEKYRDEIFNEFKNLGGDINNDIIN